MFFPDINSMMYDSLFYPFRKDRLYETSFRTFPAMYRKEGEDE